MNFSDRIKTIVAVLESEGTPFEVIEAPWVAKVEDNFNHRLPPAFRELVANFRFPEFDVAGVTVFSNLNDGSDGDITVAPFADSYMSSWLISHHFVQFGRLDTGSYDPVCFDLSEKKHDAAIVVIQHEDILLERNNVRVQQLAASFLELIDAELHNKPLQPITRKTRSG